MPSRTGGSEAFSPHAILNMIPQPSQTNIDM